MLYPIAIEPGDSQHAYGVSVPDIDGCFSAGDTLDEALANVIDAIALNLESCAEDGVPIPLATNIESHISNKEYAGYTWAVVDVDIGRYLGESEKINVTLPKRVTHLIDVAVAASGNYKSRSGFLAEASVRLLNSIS